LKALQEIGSISIFKSKNEFHKLRKGIQDNEMLLSALNYILLIVVGVIPTVLSLIDMMYPWPFGITLSIKL
jgi:hypothetical protein